MNKILCIIGVSVNVILGLLSYPLLKYYNILNYPEKRLNFYNNNPELKTIINEKSIYIIIGTFLLLIIGINLSLYLMASWKNTRKTRLLSMNIIVLVVTITISFILFFIKSPMFFPY